MTNGAQSMLPGITQGILGVIIHQENRSVIDAIDSLTTDELHAYSLYTPLDLRDYIYQQQKWIQDSAYFLGIDLGRVPTAAEIVDKLLSTDHTKRFRAYYAMCFPEKVRLEDESL